MNKIFVLRPHEDWIVDRIASEWKEANSDITVSNPAHADCLWLMADWCWRNVPVSLLTTKKIVTTVHHIVPEKFNSSAMQDFLLRDRITHVYHVPNEHTRQFISQITKKRIEVIPYWANQQIWKKTGESVELRKKYRIPENAYVIGSFQRDTEGKDLISPKLEKGPDLLVKYIDRIYSENKLVHVLLAGWRRQYIVSALEERRIPYTYIEKSAQEIVNELYQCIDIYPVTSRYEGGPQSIIECGLLGVPVVSRNVGIASQLLPASAISDDVFSAMPSIPDVESLKIPHGFKRYRELFSKL